MFEFETGSSELSEVKILKIVKLILFYGKCYFETIN